MSTSLVAACGRCKRFRCWGDNHCDDHYIRLLEDQVDYWRHVASLLGERIKIDNQMMRRGRSPLQAS